MNDRPQRLAVARAAALSRRRLLRGAAVAGAGVTLIGIAGCSSRRTSSATSGAAAGRPKRGGSLAISLNYQETFDPHVASTATASTYGYFYQNLVRTNPRSFEVEPELAQKWETPSPTEIILTLAPTVIWHNRPPANGRPLKAEDVVFSLNRAKTDDPKFIYRASLAEVDRIEATGANMLKLTLKGPNAYQLGNLASGGLKIVNPETIELARGNFAEASKVVGTGAFILQSAEPGVGSVMLRNPSYYKAGLPCIDRIDGRVFLDSGPEWAAFVAGQIDKDVVPGDQSADVDNKHKDQYNLDWNGDLGTYMLMPNTKRKPFDDPRVTRALRLLVDHDEFKSAWAALWFGRGRYASIFPAGLEAWDLTEDEYATYLEWKSPKDDAVKEAVSLLGAAGFSKEKPLKFTLVGQTTDFLAAQRLLTQAQFKRLGQGIVAPDVQAVDLSAFTSIRASGQFDCFASGNAPGGFQPDDWLSSEYHTGGGRNYGRMSDPKLDQMIDKQRTMLDGAQRKQAIRDIIVYMIDSSPYSVQVGVYDLNATKKDVMGSPPESKALKWSEHYELIWRNS